MSTVVKPAELYRDRVIELLTAENLPTNDLSETLNNFYVSVIDNEVTGVAGLEIYGECGLLRSFAVSANWRNKGIAAGLLAEVEQLAIDNGLEAIYLLTETAKEYFESKGYEHVARMDIPDAIKESPEFTHVCPETATAMQKSLL